MDPFYLAILLYLAAAVMAVVDIFVPSGGLLAILAAVAATASVLMAFRSGTTMGMSVLTLVVASIPVFAILAIKIWPRTYIGKRIILKAPDGSNPQQANKDMRLELVGTVVRADHALMPSGQIRVHGKRYNAVSEGAIIEAGQNVEIIGLKERNLIVRYTTAPPTASSRQPSDRSRDEGDQQQAKQPENPLDMPAEELGLDSLE